MNLTELARRLRATPDELREKLPALGFAIGRKAIKIDNRVASRIQEAWGEMKRRERLNEKVESQKAMAERREQNRELAAARPVEIPPVLTVRDLATRLNTPIPKLMQELMRNGILASLNERIDFDTASIISEDLGFKAIPIAAKADAPDAGKEEAIDRIREAVTSETAENLKPRAPVVVVMGHVDHGKTKLLDAIRNTQVMESEAGGITQHIGAYQAERNGRALTFIDTPGHEAFTVMRSRGAKVADIAILVVAADDGVQPQTKEAANIIQSAKLPFIVALNKIDRAEANVEKVKAQLAELNMVPEDWGGKTIVVPISAKAGTNLETLLDMLLLVADMEKERIVANPNRRALGTVVESHVDAGAGPVATVLVQSGTLRRGDVLGVGGAHYGKVRAMTDWKGERMETAPPSTPVQVLGWKAAPAVGDILEIPEDASTLEKVKTSDTSRGAEEAGGIRAPQPAATNEEGEEVEGKAALNLIIRADVLGSLEAILGMLDGIQHEKVSIKIVGKGLGNLTDTDVQNAEATHAILMGFNVKATPSAQELSRDKNVSVREYKIIYRLFEDVLAELQKLLPSETVVEEIGRFEVVALFRKTDAGYIVGGKVTSGKLLPKAKLRVKRGEAYVAEGEIAALQSGKSELKEARAGQECGLQYKGKGKPEIGDLFEAYTVEKVEQKLFIKGVTRR